MSMLVLNLTMADPVHQNVAFVIFKHRALHSLITWILRLLLSLGKLWHIYCFWVTFTPLQMFSSFNSGSCVGFVVTGSGCFWWPVVVWTGFFWTIWGRLELVICYPHSRLKSLPQQMGVFFVLLQLFSSWSDNVSEWVNLRTELTDVTLVSEDTHWRFYWQDSGN